MTLRSLVSRSTACGWALRRTAEIWVSFCNSGTPPKGFQQVTDVRTKLQKELLSCARCCQTCEPPCLYPQQQPRSLPPWGPGWAAPARGPHSQSPTWTGPACTSHSAPGTPSTAGRCWGRCS